MANPGSVPTAGLQVRDGRSLAGVRVAHLGPAPPELGGATPGGVATHLKHLLDGLAQAGEVAIHLLATNAPVPTPNAWRATDAATSYALYRVYAPPSATAWLDVAYMRAVGAGRLARYAAWLARYRGTQPLGSRRVALAHLLWYRRFIATVQPRILHVQHPAERHLYARLLADLEGWRIPLVVTLHSFFQEHPDHLIYGLMAPNLPHADRLIAVSRSTAAQAIELGADPARVRVIRSGADTERFRPRDRRAARMRLDLPPDLPVVLFVGNLEPRKAVDRLLLALREVRWAVPNATLAVVGTGASAGADDQEPLLRRLVTDLDLGEGVRFLGRLPDEVLLDWYAAADVFALPSSSEGQGIAALEAMACGLPVVASAVGGLLDTIRDGEDGYLVPFGHVPALADRLTGLLADPPLRARLGEAARATVVRDFSWQQTVARTLDVYREVLAEEPRGLYSARREAPRES